MMCQHVRALHVMSLFIYLILYMHCRALELYTLRYGQVVRAPILKVSLYLWYLLRYVLLLLCRAHVCGVCSVGAFISTYRHAAVPSTRSRFWREWPPSHRRTHSCVTLATLAHVRAGPNPVGGGRHPVRHVCNLWGVDEVWNVVVVCGFFAKHKS